MWGFDNPEFIGVYKSKDIDTIWIEYFDAIKAMAKTGLFDIVGHFDLIKVFKFLPQKDIRIIANNNNIVPIICKKVNFSYKKIVDNIIVMGVYIFIIRVETPASICFCAI